MPGEPGGAEGGRLEHARPVDRRAEGVGDALQHPVVGGHAAVDPEHGVAPASGQSARIASTRSRVWKATLSSAARASSAGPELRVRPKIAPRQSGSQ